MGLIILKNLELVDFAILVYRPSCNSCDFLLPLVCLELKPHLLLFVLLTTIAVFSSFDSVINSYHLFALLQITPNIPNSLPAYSLKNEVVRDLFFLQTLPLDLFNFRGSKPPPPVHHYVIPAQKFDVNTLLPTLLKKVSYLFLQIL